MSEQNQILPADQVLPNKLLMIALNGKPIFPGLFTPLMITSPEDLDVIRQALEGDQHIGLVLTLDENEENPRVEDLHTVGTAAKILKRINLPDGGMNIFVSTVKRFRIRKSLSSEGRPLVAAVDYLEEEETSTDEVRALTRAIISETKQVSENNPLFSEEMRLNMVNIDHPGKIADFVTSILNIDRDEQQDVLATVNVRERLEKVLLFIKKEQELLRIQKRIQKQINEKIEKSQREYFLKEELKAIKQELGMPTDSKSSEYARFQEALENLPLDEEARKQVEQELEKFQLMEPSSAEFTLTRNYLETIIQLPWEVPSARKVDLTKAERILDADHYGLEDVKERILEFLAVRTLRGDNKGSIICLVGPPGVGKTSIGKSVARALGKKFFRFSVGGMRDEAEIKGHRRTYIGAMPGKVLQGLKIVGEKDPVFMIDEIDKLGVSYQGDPSSALLEVLDPEQNNSFRDHYLDLPFDVSNILFITTANTLDSIPSPLLDRMEVIRLSGYIDEEKTMIARKYLVPRSAERAGLEKKLVKYNKAALRAIANDYARESGMRRYEQMLDKIHRKLARKQLTSEDAPESYEIGPEDLETYLGKPVFPEEAQRKISHPGMALGLAWTPYGGDTLMIEAIRNRGKSGFKLTGQMGDVMQESASIAYSRARHIAVRYGVHPSFFDENEIHIHIPAGATPKDGPSAGITMATTLLSLALDEKVRPRLAMTGELSLAGFVLPIGGLKEKTIAARRNGIKQVIIPRQNERDLNEIPEHVTRGITFHPVESLEEVLEIALGKTTAQ
ncbi:ATP dependent PIM1 peptidase. Serine peptidase. MEROPS family S16 [Alkalispirochaeta americana]|uniref:Lon protease n=1 Tax=Alkalispirochaeta americana TaxID=159291 RepID=A0A1N6V230_9SPIO|nr:endopeptidase La [Alkalispirochaeta americana]SIQ71829.1 ATP dependent PIM1 peptidase. Serine peptidase. MEROPS family S16 [Alkalispirochaeta americana]